MWSMGTTTFGARLRELMNERGVTADDLSQAVHRKPAAVRMWMCGSSSPPLHLLPALAEALGVTPADLVESL